MLFAQPISDGVYDPDLELETEMPMEVPKEMPKRHPTLTLTHSPAPALRYPASTQSSQGQFRTVMYGSCINWPRLNTKKSARELSAECI